MKKKFLAFGIAIATMFALSACEYFAPFMFQGGDSYSYKSGKPSNKSASDSPLEVSNSDDSGGSASIISGTIDNNYAPIAYQYASSTYLDVAGNSMYNLSYTPSKGNVNIVVIPVWFTDSSSYISASSKSKVREDIQKTYFGSNSDTGWRSVKSYYEEESHGALSFNGVVSDWYACNERSTVYASASSTAKTVNLVKNATNWFFSNNPSISRRDYDQDSDGYLDGIMLIYGAPDYKTAGNSNTNLWAYCFWVQDPSQESTFAPGANAFFWASYDFMYGTNKVYNRTGVINGPAGGDTRYCELDAHTYIHEMGHMFGLTDYYDYSQQYKPAGSFSMQDLNVGGHDPFSSFALGWGKAYVPTESMTIKLRPFATSGEMILLSPSYNSYGSPFDEYILLEYYTPTGLNEFDTTNAYAKYFPKGSQEIGIRLWHVDARLFYYLHGNSGSFSFTTNPNISSHHVDVAMTNTYESNDEATNKYLTRLGSSYYEYNLLQLIHNDTNITYRPNKDFSTNSLFRMGSSFDMNKYKKQFFRTGKFNKNTDLGFTFTVDDTIADYATITVTKA